MLWYESPKKPDSEDAVTITIFCSRFVNGFICIINDCEVCYLSLLKFFIFIQMLCQIQPFSSIIPKPVSLYLQKFFFIKLNWKLNAYKNKQNHKI